MYCEYFLRILVYNFQMFTKIQALPRTRRRKVIREDD